MAPRKLTNLVLRVGSEPKFERSATERRHWPTWQLLGPPGVGKIMLLEHQTCSDDRGMTGILGLQLGADLFSVGVLQVVEDG
jgi:hypothetical protein